MQIAKATRCWRALAFYHWVGKPWAKARGPIRRKGRHEQQQQHSSPVVAYVWAHMVRPSLKQRDGKHTPWSWKAKGCLLRVLLFKVWSSTITVTRHFIRNAECQGPPQHLLNWNLNFNKIPRGFICIIKFGKSQPKTIWSCHLLGSELHPDLILTS